MIPFIEKTWFLWWILSILVIVRWFHLFLSPADDSADQATPVERQGCTASDKIPPETASRLSA